MDNLAERNLTICPWLILEWTPRRKLLGVCAENQLVRFRLLMPTQKQIPLSSYGLLSCKRGNLGPQNRCMQGLNALWQPKHAPGQDFVTCLSL